MFAWAWARARAVDLVRDNAYCTYVYAAPRGAGAHDDNYPECAGARAWWECERTDEPRVQHF